MKLWEKFLKNESGATGIEVGLIVALLFVAVIGFGTYFEAEWAKDLFSNKS